MKPEDRWYGARGFDPQDDQPVPQAEAEWLDAAITARRAGRSVASPDRADLAQLVKAASALHPLARVQPSSAFADRLETRLRARAATLEAPLPHATAERSPAPSTLARRRMSLPRAAWVAIAASVAVVLTTGVLTASAQSGAPFSALRRAVEGISANFGVGPVADAQNGLQRGRAALARFDAAISQGDNAAALNALDAMNQANRQVEQAIPQVSDSAQRASFQSQFATLRASETNDLGVGLARLDWPARVRVTSTLRGLGQSTLTIISVRIESPHGGVGASAGQNSGLALITIKGEGFTAGATLLVDGAPLGTVQTVTPKVIIARAPVALVQRVTSIGVGEPDGVAAATSEINDNLDASGAGSSDPSSPDTSATPIQDANSGDSPTPTPDNSSGPSQ
ncbi:MAG TPA: hypothetical protein VF808_19100 [Ktedonobacterales bacterium]